MSNDMKIITGKAFWAHVQKPNMKFTPRWSIDIILDEEGITQVEDQGLSLKEDERGVFLTIKRNVKNAKGDNKKPPVIMDSKKNIYKGNIGNGSLVKVQYRVYKWTFGGKEGYGADLSKVMVLELVEFGGEDLDILYEEDGFITTPEVDMTNDELFNEEIFDNE